MWAIRDIIVLGVIVGSAPFCFFRPYFGVLMWAMVSFLNPHRFSWGAAVTFPVAETIAIPTLGGALIFNRGWGRIFTRDMVLFLLFWAWVTFTTLRNTQVFEFQHFAYDTWTRWQFVSKIFLMSFLTAALVDSWSRFRWLLLVIVASLSFLSVKAVPWMIATGGQFRLYGPRGTMLDDNNDVGLALTMTLPLLWFFAQCESHRWIRRIMAFTFLATIPAIFFTYSRGALVGLAVVVFAMLMTLRQRLLLLPLFMFAGLFAIFLTPESWQKRMDFRQDGALIDGSARQRLYTWNYVLNMVATHPITGAGFDSFTPEMYDRYAPGGAGVRPQGYVHGPHSVYFGVLGEHGYVGLFLYLSLIAGCQLTLIRVHRYGIRCGDQWMAGVARALQLSMVAFMVSGAFLGRQYFDYFFTLVACTVILKRLVVEEQTEPVEDHVSIIEEEQPA
jgi:probable O-glycosylation ligase (exosortase A-associated)